MAARGDYLAALEAALDALGAAGLRRRLRTPAGIDFVSNDYLGFADHPLLRQRMKEALEQVPAGAGGSRLLRGHHAVFDRIEERLADFCGVEAALLFPSGYAANTGLLQSLAGHDDLVLSDALNHASLIDGIRLSHARKLVYRHQDLEAIEDGLTQPRTGRCFVVTEAVFSMEGDLTPLAEIVGLADRHDALVIVDEAHATGLYGMRGAGRVEELGLRDRVLATVHTGGKALGAGGAWVAGPAVLRDTLVQRARPFVFSTAPLPVLAAALDAALDLVEREPQRRAEVQRKAVRLRAQLCRAGVPVRDDRSPIVPVVAGSNAAAVALQDGLAAEGFDARAVRPPTVPDGTARLRATVRFPVADQDLDRFAAAVGRLLA